MQKTAFLGKFRSLRRDESGVIIIIAALMFPVLVAFMGLSLDFGLIFHWKRRQQRAVDAACIGAATEIWRGNDTATAVDAGHDDAAVNGFDEADTARDIDVAINIPWGGSAGGVEAVITEQEVPTYFLRVVGYDELTVRSRAACGLGNYSTGCLFVLDEDDRGSLTAQGTIEFDSDCEVMVNSDHDRAITINGTACLNASYIGTVGDYVNNGVANAGCMSDQEIAVNLDTPLHPDGSGGFTDNPLYQYTPPNPVGTALDIWRADDKSAVDGEILEPGRYNGVSNKSIRITGGSVYFRSGVFILDSGMSITGGLTQIVDGSGNVSTGAGDPGVSFFLTSSDGTWNFLTITGNAEVKLYAPATGDYAGWLFWEGEGPPDNSPGHRIVGTSDSEIVGIISFPDRDLFWGGTSTTSDWVMLVVNNLTIAGGAIIPASGLNNSPIPNPIQTVTLLE